MTCADYRTQNMKITLSLFLFYKIYDILTLKIYTISTAFDYPFKKDVQNISVDWFDVFSYHNVQTDESITYTNTFDDLNYLVVYILKINPK